MANPEYDKFVKNVRDWSNKDEEALPIGIIQDAISYAADRTYHQLQAPPLESTLTYDALTSDDFDQHRNQGMTQVELAIPGDLISFIQLRTTGQQGCVFNEKTDVRTGRDMQADKTSTAFWFRQGGNIYAVGGGAGTGTVFELFYYRRLPAVNATYDVNQANIDALDILHSTGSTPVYPPTYPITDGDVATQDDDVTEVSSYDFMTAITDDVTDEDNPVTTMHPGLFPAGNLASRIVTAENTVDMVAENLVTTGFYYQEEIPHWLRDENRRILLFGALMECGHYLQDTVLMQANEARMMAEIEAVNREEKFRQASGGNVKINFSSSLIGRGRAI